MRTLTALVGGAALLMTAGSAGAAVVNATDVMASNPGVVLKAGADADRYVDTSTLGAADGQFYSLGRGGDITLGFGKTISGVTDIRISEVTYGSLGHIAGYGEAVDVFAVLGGASTLVGRLTNYEAYTGGLLNYVGTFDSLRFVDVTGEAFGTTPSFDGFDIDSVELTTLALVPVPAAGGLALAGLGGLMLLRRSRRR